MNLIRLRAPFMLAPGLAAATAILQRLEILDRLNFGEK